MTSPRLIGVPPMTDPALIPADVVLTPFPEGEVVYGMQLPIQSQSTLYVADWEKEAGPVELARIARVADEAGFFYLGVCDHTAIPRRLADAMGTVWYDTTATLGWLAAVTTHTHLLSHVLILAQRHPLRVAKELSTIDHLSGGRLIVGVGAGHVPEEYELLTGDFAERGRHTDEAVSALARAFTDEFPELPGPRFPARDMGIAPVPGAPAPPAYLDRRLLAGGHPAHGSLRGRLAPPGDTSARSAGPDRPPARAARRAARRGTDRHRHHRGAHLPHVGRFFGPGPARLGPRRAERTRRPPLCASSSTWASITCRSASWPGARRIFCEQTARFGVEVGAQLNH